MVRRHKNPLGWVLHAPLYTPTPSKKFELQKPIVSSLDLIRFIMARQYIITRNNIELVLAHLIAS
jgi:hypothetical protein